MFWWNISYTPLFLITIALYTLGIWLMVLHTSIFKLHQLPSCHTWVFVCYTKNAIKNDTDSRFHLQEGQASLWQSKVHVARDSVSTKRSFQEVTDVNALGGSDGKESALNSGDLGVIPGLGRPPGEGNGCPPQYSCLENSKEREAFRATVRGAAKSRTWLRDFHFHFHGKNNLQ